ncbi:unnamed protein product, partial [Prorocentrum cordatum]
MNELAEAWAARWLPSIFMDLSFNDFTEWMEWCVPYLTGVLRRPQFDAIFAVDDLAGDTQKRHRTAMDICESNGHKSACAREKKKLLNIVPAVAGWLLMGPFAMKTAGYLKILRGPPSNLWPTFKTLSGAWTTSYRSHVNLHKFQCLPGCPCSESQRNIDDISHYLTCPRLWSHLRQPRGVVSAHLLTRMGLNGEIYDGENNIRHVIARVAVAFKTCNFLRIQNSLTSCSPSSGNELWVVDNIVDPYNKNAAAVAAS